MIKDKNDLRYYIKEDRRKNPRKIRLMYFENEVGRYLYYLRKNEYFQNKKKKTCIDLLAKSFYRYKKHRLGVILGFDIPTNVVNEGLRIDHWGFLAISGKAKIEKNCHIYGDITIGVKDETDKNAPHIGDNVTIGAGARIIGDIKIASGTVIGANCVVTKSITRENSIVVGVPGENIARD